MATASPLPRARRAAYRPLAPDALYLTAKDWRAAEKARPIHLITPFDAPEAPGVIDLNVHAARDFAPERAADANVYALVAEHLAAEQRAGRRTIIASYSLGARDRLRACCANMARRCWPRRIAGRRLLG